MEIHCIQDPYRRRTASFDSPAKLFLHHESVEEYDGGVKG